MSFPGLCNVLRRFVLNFARTAAPLYRKLENDQAFLFGRQKDTEIVVLETLLHRLLSQLILSPPRRNGRYSLDTDASVNQIWCILLKEQPEGPAKLVRYWARLLNRAEKAYNTTNRERLDVELAVFLLMMNLEGPQLTIPTDYDAL